MKTNVEVADTLEEVADLLVAKKELPFKIRAYRKAAASLRQLETPLEQYRLEHDLREIPGVGNAIAKKISDLLDTGTFRLLEELRGQRPGH